MRDLNRRAPLAPAAAVLAACLALALFGEVTLGEALLFGAYELGFVVLPGVLLLLALSRRRFGALGTLALGWALGYALEILAFMGTAAMGARWLFALYPLIVCVPAGLMLIARHRSGDRVLELAPVSRRLAWLIAAVAIGGAAYVALSYFSTAPLPGEMATGYFVDYPRWISLAAEAMNHWPLEEPSVVGEPLPYHYFVNVHLAAVSQVTGLGLPLIFLRLFFLPLVVVSVLLVVTAGRHLASSTAVGLVAAGLAFFVAELQLDGSETFLAQTPFFGLSLTLLVQSPSYLLGLVFLLPLLILLAPGDRLEVRDWALVALFMVGASNAKVTILPLLIGALVLFAAFTFFRRRPISPQIPLAVGLAVVVVGALWLIQYQGSASGLQLNAFGDVEQMPAVELVQSDLMQSLGSFPGRDALLDVGGVAFGIFGLLAAPLVGIVWLLVRRRGRLSDHQLWLLAFLITGLVASFALAEPGTQAGMYFLFYGLFAGYLLSAEGLVGAWRARPELGHRWRTVAAVGSLLIGLVAAMLLLPTDLGVFDPRIDNGLPTIARYGGLALALAATWFFMARSGGPGRWVAGALVTGCLLAIGLLATPLDRVRAIADNPRGNAGLLAKPLTPELYDGLSWVRDETPTDSVIAVNNHWADYENTIPLEFIYSAFAERRVFLEGWGYSQAVRDEGYENLLEVNPYEDRLALNLAAFGDADPDALATLRDDFGVDFLVVDEVNGYPVDLRGLSANAEVVYEAPGVTVLELP